MERENSRGICSLYRTDPKPKTDWRRDSGPLATTHKTFLCCWLSFFHHFFLLHFLKREKEKREKKGTEISKTWGKKKKKGNKEFPDSTPHNVHLLVVYRRCSVWPPPLKINRPGRRHHRVSACHTHTHRQTDTRRGANATAPPFRGWTCLLRELTAERGGGRHNTWCAVRGKTK